jgi:hypothetical protein
MLFGTKGDIYFVDLGQYIWADKGGIQSAQSVHVKFIQDETTYRWVKKAPHEGDFMVKSSLIRGNLSHSIRQSRASKDLKSWASVETLQGPSLTGDEEQVRAYAKA